MDLRNAGPVDILKYYYTSQIVTIVYAGEYTVPKVGQVVDLFLIKEYGFNYARGEGILFDLLI